MSRIVLSVGLAIGGLVANRALAVKIDITVVSGMSFTDATQGDAAETITPGGPGGAIFLVTGDPGATYNILLPTATTTHNMSGPGANISVASFVTIPSGTGTLDASGMQTLYVGGTRAAIPAGQVPGNYSGPVNVRVRYTTGGPLAKETTGTLSLRVMATITLSKTADLAFGTVNAGDISQTVSPLVAGGRAAFTVTGEPNTAYTVTLPADGTVTMITGGGGVNRQIAVDSFTSFPSATGNLSAGGSETLYVGATRSALPITQISGAYSGSFTVTVAY